MPMRPAWRCPSGSNCSAALARAIDRSFAEAWLPFQLRFQLKARGTRWSAGSRPVGDAGQRFALIDLVIGALSNELTALIWSLDRDFQRMAALGFVHLYR